MGGVSKDAAVAALERAVYLLDRGHEPGFRVQAFLRAAETVRATDAAELVERAAAGTLTDLEHVGDTTAAVITEALQGRTPSYLRALEERTRVPVTPEGAAVRALLRGDCHSHTRWSDGGASVEAMARAAAALGHEYLVITDHSPRLTVAHGLTRERLVRQLDEIDRLRPELAPFRLLTGIEVDILEDGSLDADPDILERLDLVVASVHSKLRMDPQRMTERMVLAVASPHVDVLGHCTGRLIGKRPASSFDPDYVFAACARFGTAVEINCRPERRDPPDELVQIALSHGCEFVISTDAHAPGQLEWQPYGCDIAARNRVPPDRIVNTRSAADLTAWTATK